MKKLLLILFIWFLTFWSIFTVKADWETIEVIVSTDIPWAGCLPCGWEKWDDCSQASTSNSTDQEKKTWLLYKCTVKRWMKWFAEMIWKIVQNATFIVLLFWVLFLVVNWVLYAMWWLNPEFRTRSKDLIIKTILWIILLLLSWYILVWLAPWVYKWG